MAGYKEILDEEMEDEAEVETPDEMKDWKPCLYLTSKDDPSISSLKLGEKVTKEFRVKSITKSEGKKGEENSVELELI